MDEKTMKKRAWIKNAIIIFLVIMLILTFFSNTIMNRSLPVVDAQYAYGNTVTTKVRGTGNVRANYSYDVILDESRKIAQVMVRAGQTVEKGDTLFLLEDEESVELSAALETLSSLNDAYNDLLLTMKETDIGEEYVDKADRENIASLRQQLSDEMAKKDSLAAASEAYAKAKAATKEAKKLCESLEKQINELQSEIGEVTAEITEKIDKGQSIESQLSTARQRLAAAESALVSAKNDLAYAKIMVDAAKHNQEIAQQAYDKAQNEMSSHEAESELKESLISALYNLRQQVDSLNDTLNQDGEKTDLEESSSERMLKDQKYYTKYAFPNGYDDYIVILDDYLNCKKDKAALDEATEAYLLTNSRDEQLVIQLTSLYHYADEIRSAKQQEVTSLLQSLEDQKLSIKYTFPNGYEDYIKALEAYEADSESNSEYLDKAASDYIKLYSNDSNVTNANDKLNAAEKALNDAKNNYTFWSDSITDFETKLAEAEAEESKAKTLVTSLEAALSGESLNDQLDQLKEKKEAADEAWQAATEAEADAAEKASVTPESIDAAIKSLQNELNRALDEYEKKGRTDEISDQKDNIVLKQKKEEIEKQEKEVEKLRAKAVDAEVTATISGSVSSVNCVAGETVTAGTALASLEVKDKGYTAEITVTNEESRRISLGDSASVSNWWYGDLTCTVISVRPDPSQPNTHKIVTLNLTGELTPGQSLDFVIGERGQYYDTVVPKSAIREDSNGKFVLVLIAKSSPLGNRYFAQRMDVEEIVSDDVNVAVSGLLGSEFVIRTATVPIEDGQQVRLKEN